LSDSFVTGSSGDGIGIVDSLSITVSNTIIQGNAGNGLVINSQSLITIQNCIINANGKNDVGIYAQNNIAISDVEILDCMITNSGASVGGNPAQPWVWDGVNINTDLNTGGNCTHIQISNCFIGNQDGTTPTQNFGLRSLHNSDYVQVVQNDFFNNLAGNFSLVGANNSIANNI
jgi:Right handed beta helix region